MARSDEDEQRDPELYTSSCRGKLYQFTWVYPEAIPYLPRAYIANGERYFPGRDDGVQPTLSFYRSAAGRPYALLERSLESEVVQRAETHSAKGIKADGWIHVMGIMRVPSDELLQGRGCLWPTWGPGEQAVTCSAPWAIIPGGFPEVSPNARDLLRPKGVRSMYAILEATTSPLKPCIFLKCLQLEKLLRLAVNRQQGLEYSNHSPTEAVLFCVVAAPSFPCEKNAPEPEENAHAIGDWIKYHKEELPMLYQMWELGRVYFMKNAEFPVARKDFMGRDEEMEHLCRHLEFCQINLHGGINSSLSMTDTTLWDLHQRIERVERRLGAGSMSPATAAALAYGNMADPAFALELQPSSAAAAAAAFTWPYGGLPTGEVQQRLAGVPATMLDGLQRHYELAIEALTRRESDLEVLKLKPQKSRNQRRRAAHMEINHKGLPQLKQSLAAALDEVKKRHG